MAASIRIIGQGLAGSLLAWECERRGLPFHLIDAGHGRAASRVGAGIINPITGQRVVKSWRVDELLPIAKRCYAELESAIGRRVMDPIRVRRIFRDDRERAVAREKFSAGELAPFVREIDDEGFWIASALRVDTAALITGLRERWRATGRLEERQVEFAEFAAGDTPTIWCVGAGELAAERFRFVGFRPAKGEILCVRCERLEPGVVVNDGHWLLPVGEHEARVGATFDRVSVDLQPSTAARELLTASAERLAKQAVEVLGQEVGVRVTTPDKHPTIGWHPGLTGVGLVNGLGSKSALLTPWLAQQWADHLAGGGDFDAAVDVRRFWKQPTR